LQHRVDPQGLVDIQCEITKKDFAKARLEDRHLVSSWREYVYHEISQGAALNPALVACRGMGNNHRGARDCCPTGIG
jgi:hypothetical protein